MRILFACGGLPNQPEEPIVSWLRKPLLELGHKLQLICLPLRSNEEELEKRIIQEVQLNVNSPTWILGGFSLGARIAARASKKLNPSGLFLLGYPFHHCRKPKEDLGLKHVHENPQTKTIVIQGELDPFGSKQSLEQLKCPSTLRIEWIKDANHRFESKGKVHKDAVISHCIDFVRSIEKVAS